MSGQKIIDGLQEALDLAKLVKRLVWRQVEPHIYAAETSAHRYAIFDLDAGPILTRDSLQVASGAMPDLKTFAQADYAARVISALDPEALARWREGAVQAALMEATTAAKVTADKLDAKGDEAAAAGALEAALAIANIRARKGGAA